jgi:hypothetical protein
MELHFQKEGDIIAEALPAMAIFQTLPKGNLIRCKRSPKEKSG